MNIPQLCLLRSLLQKGLPAELLDIFLESVMKEVWKSVVGSNGKYEVSSLGRVRSLPRVVMRRDGALYTVRGRTLTPYKGPSGYLAVRVIQYGRWRQRFVHQLVLESFVGPRPEWAEEVRHIDGDRFNNRIDNLRWGTRLENAADRAVHGVENFGERNGNARWTEATVREMHAAFRAGESARSIARRLGTRTYNVKRILKGDRWPHCKEAG